METFVTVSLIVLWAAVIVQTVVIVMLTKLMAQFLQRFRTVNGRIEDGLNYGDYAPLFRAKDQYGRVVRLKEEVGRPTLLFFGKQTCDKCHELAPQLGALERKFNLRLLVVTGMDRYGTPLQIPAGVSLIQSDEIRENYRIDRMPSAVLVNPSGMVLFSESITNLLQLSHLLEQSMNKAAS